MAKASSGGKKRDNCSFCGRSRKVSDAFVEGPGGIFICPECVELCYNIVKQERKRTQGASAMLEEIPNPRNIKEFLDQYVIGQENAKKCLAVAVHGVR